jgi:signal transduction histidine kinase
MLYKFLKTNRDALLAATRKKTTGLAPDLPVTKESEKGLPQFYDHLIQELRREQQGLRKRSERKHGPYSTTHHGQELSRLGYTVSQVVHGYGTLCQAITELADKVDEPITASEFSVLNLSLDVAIADAVTGFSAASTTDGTNSVKRMGFLIHELRNALTAAIIAHSMVKKGVVGTGGSTNALLERNLMRMRDLLDRSFAEVRMQSENKVELLPEVLLRLVEEVEATAAEEARSKGLSIKVLVDPSLSVDGDHNFLISALSNLVQNAVKYSKKGGVIRVRGLRRQGHIVLEVEDECGGLPKGKAEELFKPFTQKGADRTGLGLGLTISRRAVELNKGTLSVRDLPGKGCIFSISLPDPRALVKEAA